MKINEFYLHLMIREYKKWKSTKKIFLTISIGLHICILFQLHFAVLRVIYIDIAHTFQ